MSKSKTYTNANGYEVEKIMKPYGAAPKETKKFKKSKKIRRDTIRYQE